MKSLVAWLTVCCLATMAVSAMAQNIIYENGPVNGQELGFTINLGFVISDSFTVANGNGNIGGMDFWAWLIPDDTITSVEVQIGNEALGNNLMDLTVGVTSSNCFLNQYDYNVCIESASFSGPNLSNGTYWVSLGNAMVPDGNPAYWDENNGVGCQSEGCPSGAQNNIGDDTLPSESFTILGQGTTTSTGSTPEPGGLVLFASGVLGLAGVLRRKLL